MLLARMTESCNYVRHPFGETVDFLHLTCVHTTKWIDTEQDPVCVFLGGGLCQ
jgi:hypothetical protein